MKARRIIYTAFACLPFFAIFFLSGCRWIGEKAEDTEYYIYRYIKLDTTYTRLHVVESDDGYQSLCSSVGNDGFSLDLTVNGMLFTPIKRSALYKRFARRYEKPGKFKINFGAVGPSGGPTSTYDEIVSMDAFALTDYDEKHPEKSSLRDLVTFWYLSYKPFIDGGRKKPDMEGGNTTPFCTPLDNFSRVVLPSCTCCAKGGRGEGLDTNPRLLGKFIFSAKPTNPEARIKIVITLDSGRKYELEYQFGESGE